MLTRRGVLVVFGVQGDSSFIRLPDGHKNSRGQRKRNKGLERDIG